MKLTSMGAFGGAIFVLGALQACGGGGGGGAAAPIAASGVAIAGATPIASTAGAEGERAGTRTDTATATATATAPESGTSTATPAPAPAAAPPASPAAVAPPIPAAPAAFVAQSAAGVALQAGMYAVSYGMGTLNGEPDKSIWQSKLVGLADGSQQVSSVVYAGNQAGGSDVVADALRPMFDKTSVNGTSSAVLYAHLDDANSKLAVGRYDSQGGFVTLFDWTLRVDATDVSGQSIQDFLRRNRSLTKPIAGLTVAGNFASGARSYRLHYGATADRFVFGRSEPFINSQADFERSSDCGMSSDATTRLARTFDPAGYFEILEIAQGTTCTASVLAAGTLIGIGSWTRSSSGGVDHIRLDFPPGIPASRYDDTYLQSEYDAGVREVMLVPNGGRWSSGYLVPAGVSFQSRNLSLNKVGADSVRSATGM